jgi:hypothetical protein
MKNILFTAFCLLLSFNIFAIEEPAHQVLDKDGDFEVRMYDQILVAEVTCKFAKEYDDCGSENFRVLFKYITGSNERNEKIEMTAPVIQTLKNQKWTMAFAMPASYQALGELPLAFDKRITLKEYKNLKVGVKKFSGFMSTSKINSNLDQLFNWLKVNEYKKSSTDFMVARYNGPWSLPFLRRHEVWTNLQ